MGPRRIEIGAVFDQIRAECLHGGVLLRAVAVWHHNRHRHAMPGAGIGEALAMIAAGGADDPGRSQGPAGQRVEIGEAATHLEGAGWRMVFMLDPDFGARPRGQQRPGILRCRREGLVDEAEGGLQRGQVEHRASMRDRPALGKPRFREGFVEEDHTVIHLNEDSLL